MRKSGWTVAAGAIIATGCLSINKPLLEVSGGSEPVDSKRVPATSSHEEARAELKKAYAHIESLERKNADLSADRDKLKRERDDCRKQREGD
jgi:hypothetical protein